MTTADAISSAFPNQRNPFQAVAADGIPFSYSFPSVSLTLAGAARQRQKRARTGSMLVNSVHNALATLTSLATLEDCKIRASNASAGTQWSAVDAAPMPCPLLWASGAGGLPSASQYDRNWGKEEKPTGPTSPSM